MSHSNKPTAVYGAMIANLGIAAVKFAAAAFTGSSAMLSEGIHSFVDTGNQVLLLIGRKRSLRPPDAGHPFGHAMEIYFWGLIVAVIIFGLGGGVSLYEGFAHLSHPTEIENPLINYIVLGVSVLLESVSFVVAYKELKKENSKDTLWSAIRRSKDPAVFVVLLEDAAALAGLVIALLGLTLGALLNEPRFDAIASLLIGVLLAGVAVMLTWESRGLLLGESASADVIEDIVVRASEDPAVDVVLPPRTMHLGPQEVLLNLDIRFTEGLTAQEMTNAIDRIEEMIAARHPEIKYIYIEADSFLPSEKRQTKHAGRKKRKPSV